MTLIGFLRVMRRWRWVIVAGGVIGVVVGSVSALGAPTATTTFEATNTLVLDSRAGNGSEIARLNQVLVTLGPVPDRVAARLGLDPRRVRSMVSADARNPGVMLITGRSTDRAQAEALANVTAQELIVELGGSKSPLQSLERAVAKPVHTDDIKGPSSGPGRGLMLGAFGLLLGIGAGFVVDRFDDRIRSKRTAEEALGVPVIGEVPSLRRSSRDRLLAGAEPSSVIEAYRGLRTFVTAWSPATEGANGHRVIVVTSATAGEGKTSAVAQLGLALAEIGRSVLVISADLRRPRLHLYFERSREPGLVDVLRGAPDARKLTQLNLTTAVRGVQLLPSGRPVDNPGPFLEHVGGLLDDARGLCDFVLVDSPPLLVANDAAVLARHADCVLLVVRAGRTSIGAAARSAELLQRLDVAIIGAVLIASDHG